MRRHTQAWAFSHYTCAFILFQLAKWSNSNQQESWNDGNIIRNVCSIYMKTSCTWGPTLYQWCSAAHLKWQSHCCHFIKQLMWIVKKKIHFPENAIHINHFLKIHPQLCEVVKLNHLLQTPPPYATASCSLLTAHKHLSTAHKCIQALSPCLIISICQHKGKFYFNTVYVGERKGWQSIWANHRLTHWLWLILCDWRLQTDVCVVDFSA